MVSTIYLKVSNSKELHGQVLTFLLSVTCFSITLAPSIVAPAAPIIPVP